HSPGRMNRASVASPPLLELGYIPLHPSKDGRVRDGDAALGHHLDQIPIAEPICEVPADAQLDNFGLKSATPVDGVTHDGLGHGALPLAARTLNMPWLHQNPMKPPRA